MSMLGQRGANFSCKRQMSTANTAAKMASTAVPPKNTVKPAAAKMLPR